MKKSFLILAAAATLMLAGCKTNKPHGGKGDGVNVPTEAGKTTFYFTVGEGSAELPAHASYYLTGGFACEEGTTDWPTAADKVVEFQKLEGSDNVYYGMFPEVAKDSTVDKYYNYQLTVGYNPSSGAPGTGVNWSYKSVECQAYEYGTDPTFTVAENGTVNLGTHTWTEMPAAPKILHNLTINVTFAEAVPENVALYMPGNFKNNWACSAEQDAMTPSTDRKTWSIVVPEVVAGNKEAKIIAEYVDAAWTWGHTILDDGAGGNYALMLKGTWGDNYTLNLNEQIDPETAAPIAYDFATELPAADKFDVKVTLVGDAEITKEKLYINGAFNGWKCAEMTRVNTTTFEYTIADNMLAELEFGILADTDWHVAVKMANDGNTKAAVTKSAANVTITLAEGGAAFLNQETPATEWLTWNKGTLADANGVNEYPVIRNSVKDAYSAQPGDVVTVQGIIKKGYAGTPKVDNAYSPENLDEFFNGMFIENGDAGIMVYQQNGVKLPDGIKVGDAVEVTGALDIFNGLYQIKAPTEIKAIEDAGYAHELTTITTAPGLGELNRLVALDGRVISVTNTFGECKTGAKDVTVKVRMVGDIDVTVFFKKAGGFDYDTLAVKCIEGANVHVEGFVSIFDKTNPVDYANSTGYQIVAPTLTVVVD